MEAPPAQQAISTRPQQPIEAYAATLPVETLTRIFELALQHFVWPNEEKGQAQRVMYGLVCRSWCSAALPLPHYIVSSSVKAERLADLLRTTVRSRQAVRSLDIIAEEDRATGRGARIVKLLKLCPNLARVTLQIDRDLCAPGRRLQDGSLGKVVQDVLASLDLIVFEFYGRIPVAVLQRLLQAWPRLETLDLWSDASYIGDPIIPSPSRLRSLSLPGALDLKLIRALITATASTLEVFNVGEVYPTEGEELVALIKPVLPQLVKFNIADGEKPTRGPYAQHPRAIGTYLESALKEMHRIRYLTLGLDGFDPANLFRLLTELKDLRHFTLKECKHSPKEEVETFEAHAPALLSFIEACDPAMTTISLPASIELGDTMHSQLNEALKKKGAKLVWNF